MRFAWRVVMVVILMGFIASCTRGSTDAPAALAPVALAPGERLRVVATTTIVADIVVQVAGELIEVRTLLPLGADPHAFEPAPRDVVILEDAHVVVANGAGLETFLAPFIATAGRGVPVVELSEGIALRDAPPGDPEHASEEGAEGDPHTWTSPANAIVFARNAADAFATLDPDHADAYRAGAEAYVAQLEALDAWVRGEIETIPPESRVLVSDHDVFGYYADRYGLAQIGAIIPAFSTMAQPSAGEFAALQATIRERGVKAVFVGTTVNPATADQLARDLGIRVVALYTGSLGPAGSGADTYIDYTRYNTNAIVGALR